MNANELRTGNLLSNPIFRATVKVHGIVWYNSEEAHRINIGSSVVELETLFPIPLTEEWLIKFGFTADEQSWFHKKIQAHSFKRNSVSFNTEDNKCIISCRGFEEVTQVELKHIKHVHSLQNLYFALTGEELTINP